MHDATPIDEKKRVESLRDLNILDTQPEERFDRFTRLAKKIFDVPIALVSLVDSNRLWLKSRIGIDVCEAPRSIAFCSHVVINNNPVIVPDMQLDSRFCDNVLVTGDPYIRFYAGHPIRDLKGQPLGTVCIMDTEPRAFTKEDTGCLKDLAESAQSELVAIQMAIEDELTGLPNRRGFLHQAQITVNLCYRIGRPASLIFLDLTRFKHINDTYGHHEGDHALKAFAHGLNKISRESDLPARLSGDEFVILLCDASANEAFDFVKRLRQVISDYNADSQRGYDITFSEGIVELELDKEHDISALLQQADALMYKQKLLNKSVR